MRSWGSRGPAGIAAGVFVLHAKETIAPAPRKDCGGLVDALGVVPVGLVKRRTLADGTVDQVGSVRSVLGIDVRLDGDEKLFRRVRKASENRLASDDDYLVVRDLRCRADNVLQIDAVHRARSIASRTSRQIRHRVRGSMTPANGVTWRSARASSLSSTRNARISERGLDSTSSQARAQWGETSADSSQRRTRARARSRVSGSETSLSAIARWRARLRSSASRWAFTTFNCNAAGSSSARERDAETISASCFAVSSARFFSHAYLCWGSHVQLKTNLPTISILLPLSSVNPTVTWRVRPFLIVAPKVKTTGFNSRVALASRRFEPVC